MPRPFPSHIPDIRLVYSARDAVACKDAAMARLMIVPIEDRGDAVLVFTRYAETELVGFILLSTLATLFEHAPRDCDCIELIRRNLPRLEAVLLRKRRENGDTQGVIPCVELTGADLPNLDLPNYKMRGSLAGEKPSEVCRRIRNGSSFLRH
jgi:hypothetical protein